MGFSDVGGFVVFFNLALVRVFARVLFFLKQRRGGGLLVFSFGVGFIIW